MTVTNEKQCLKTFTLAVSHAQDGMEVNMKKSA